MELTKEELKTSIMSIFETYQPEFKNKRLFDAIINSMEISAITKQNSNPDELVKLVVSFKLNTENLYGSKTTSA